MLWTTLLCGLSFLISTFLGCWLGVELAVQRTRPWTAMVMGCCLVLESLPGFLVGMALLLIFSLKLWLFPFFGALEVTPRVSGPAGLGLGILWHLVLPTLTLVSLALIGFGLESRFEPTLRS